MFWDIFRDMKPKCVLKSSLDGINTLCNTIVLVSATILALLLTVLSISTDSSSRLKEDHYKNVLTIAKLDTVVFIVAMIAFLLLNIPITELKRDSDHIFYGYLLYFDRSGLPFVGRPYNRDAHALQHRS